MIIFNGLNKHIHKLVKLQRQINKIHRIPTLKKINRITFETHDIVLNVWNH